MTDHQSDAELYFDRLLQIIEKRDHEALARLAPYEQGLVMAAANGTATLMLVLAVRLAAGK